ncbi:hypothetical protein H072_6052 [Dactylellina haptotyla CBS 200.50]|uniref:Major facilitator superfamily (MFS) profile domain-containing protein n=1 Tax=Dactylellina haptotyla (strain CBS 200.50) TaxID=1284197 RepID=S8BXT0_DACHA|nr:hypothetical protein H072_6052 [Dactylellina haptotyla CBS 200.50]
MALASLQLRCLLILRSIQQSTKLLPYKNATAPSILIGRTTEVLPSHGRAIDQVEEPRLSTDSDKTIVEDCTDWRQDEKCILQSQRRNSIASTIVKRNEEAEEVEDESKYPGNVTLAILTIGLCLSIFVVALDNSIIATAIPSITTQFGSIGDVGWYGSSYLLTQTSLQPVFGKIYTHFNVKWTFLIALFIFEIGSLICATAPSSTAFIVGRAIAGIGAAALFCGGITIIGHTVPLRKRPIYITALSSMFGVSSVLGLLLGGAFTDSKSLTWRWCFWINLPIGGIAFIVVLFCFKSPVSTTSLPLKERIQSINPLGAFFLICSITCLLLALQWGGFTYEWSNSKVYGCLIGFGLMMLVFVYIQFREQDLATIPPRIFRNRTVLASCGFLMFLSMALYAHIYFLPFYFQAVRGTSAVDSGVRCIPYLVSIVIGSIVVGVTVTRIGYYTPFMWASAIFFIVGAGLLQTLEVNSSSEKLIGYQILCGLGVGLGLQVPFIAVQVVLSSEDIAIGSALANFFNSLGGAISISIVQNIFTNRLFRELPKFAPSNNQQLAATALRSVMLLKNLPEISRAFNIAITTCFILPIIVGCIALLCSLGVEMKSVKDKNINVACGA